MSFARNLDHAKRAPVILTKDSDVSEITQKSAVGTEKCQHLFPHQSDNTTLDHQVEQIDYKVDADYLLNEIQTDIRSAAKYAAEDEMKKRAIHEASDYDDFRARVACASDGLRPVGRDEMQQLIRPGDRSGETRNGTKNSFYIKECPTMNRRGERTRTGRMRKGRPGSDNRRLGDSNVKDDILPSKPPRNFAEFKRDWKSIRNDKTKFRYLSSCLPTPELAVSELFRTEIDADSLGEILETLSFGVSQRNISMEDDVVGVQDNSLFQNDDILLKLVLGWILALPGCHRFSINILFLTKNQREVLASIIAWLETRNFTEILIRSENANQVSSFTKYKECTAKEIIDKIKWYYYAATS